MNKRKSKEPKPNTAKAQAVQAQETGTKRGPESDILALQHSAGNQATGRLLHGAQGQPLDETTRARMEARLGRDFGNVQIHTGGAAAQAAAGIDAAAFTSGQDIAFAAGRYAPHTAEGEQLLAHELTHVAQQEQAPSIENRVSRPGEPAERAADQGMVQPGAAVPAVQRQPTVIPDKRSGTLATKEEVANALTSYLYKVLEQQGGQTLRVTPQVKFAIQRLVQGDLNATLRLDAFLGGSIFPGSPAEFAAEVAKRLPNTIPRKNAEHLGVESVKETPSTGPKSFGEAAGETVTKSTVEPLVRKLPIPKTWQDKIIKGAAEAVGAGIVAIVEQAMSEAPLDATTKNVIKNLVEGAIKEKGAGFNRQQEGAGSPFRHEPPPSGAPKLDKAPGEHIFTLPPIPFDLPGTRSAPKPNIPRPPLASEGGAVSAAIAAIDNNVLVPPEVRGTPAAGDYAQAQELARNLANLLDAAHKAKQFSVDLQIGANYASVKDLPAIFDAVASIVQQIREALPHRAANVGQVIVSVAGRPNLRRIVRLGAGQ